MAARQQGGGSAAKCRRLSGVGRGRQGLIRGIVDFVRPTCDEDAAIGQERGRVVFVAAGKARGGGENARGWIVEFGAVEVNFGASTAEARRDQNTAIGQKRGGVIGARIGSRFGARLRGDQLRLLLALLVLAVAAKLAFDVTVHPADPYSIVVDKT